MMDTKKRKAADATSQSKKLRGSIRDKSEFVSVKVGMREFKKRLAATSEGDTTAAVARNKVEDLTVKPRNRATLKPKSSSKSVAVKRTLMTTAASKPTLAQVKRQLEREQKERVESRIQSLRRDQRPTAAASTATAVVNVLTPSSVDLETAVADSEQVASTSQSQTGGAFVVSKELLTRSSDNDFIADDAEEDFMFAMALEEVEKKLGKSQTLSRIGGAIAGTALSSSTSISLPESLDKSLPVTSVLVQVEAQPKQPAEAVQREEQTDATPEVLKEIERLRRENNLLRRSNELLQAAVTSPAQVQTCTLSDRLDATDTLAIQAQDVLLNAPTGKSSARYLDLARCDGKQHMKPTLSCDDHHVYEHGTDRSVSEKHCKNVALTLNKKEKDLCRDQHKLENEKEPATESVIATAHASDMPRDFALQTLVTTTRPYAHSTCEESARHVSTQMAVRAYEPIEASDIASLQPLKPSPSTQSTMDCCALVSDVKDNEEVDGKDEREGRTFDQDKPTARTSTVDSGNYAEYKARQESDDEDKSIAEFHDSKVTALKKELTEERATLSSSDKTTAASNSDDEQDAGKEEAIDVKQTKRRYVRASSSSESDSEDEVSDLNVLEAALKAASGERGRNHVTRPFCMDNGTARGKTPLLSAKSVSKKRKIRGLVSSSAKANSSTRSSLLWPALDEFYGFLLDMSPSNVRGSEQSRVRLAQYAGGKLPTKHSSIKDYCRVQLEAVMEELMASVRNTTGRTAIGSSGLPRRLPLSSISPCGVSRGSTSSNGLNLSAIFSESGLTGSAFSNNDYILTFDASAASKKCSPEFASGDLVLIRSPHWKKYELCVFGVVLCDSVVAAGGKSNSRGNKGGEAFADRDQICVLLRTHKRDQDKAAGDFSALTELCLSNQRTPSWRWSIQQVHNTTTSAREFQAIKAISFLPNDLQQVLLRGRFALSTTKQLQSSSLASSTMLSPRLLQHLRKEYNDSQVQAILGCLGENSRSIIQGPPGTGKTKTILGLLSALLDGGGLSALQKVKGTARVRVGASLQSTQTSAVFKTVAETSIRVLVAAPSNAAVDELVVRVLSEGLFDGEKGKSFCPRIVRVGRPESSQQLSALAVAREARDSKKNYKKMRKYAHEVEEVLLESLVAKHRSAFPTVKQTRQAIIKNAQIVFCTLSGAGSVAMCDFAQDFDALIIDEAAQAVEASTLIPFKFRPHRVVLVGDHRQLPATVISKKLLSLGYERSLQQRLVENGSPVLLLAQQYRMHPAIAKFPSAYFYGGRLVQDDKMHEWTAQDYHCDQIFKPLVFLDVQGAQSQISGSTSLRNMNEVEAVVHLVRRLLRKFPCAEWKKRIGVIAPYKQQIYELRGAIGKLEAEFDRHLDIEVNTVDGFQGREKEIIIYSCVRTSHHGRRKKKRRSLGNDDIVNAFWADERRMNVAITRAKSSLWIVGNSTLLKQSRAWRALIQHTKDCKCYVASSAATFLSASSSNEAII